MYYLLPNLLAIILLFLCLAIELRLTVSFLNCESCPLVLHIFEKDNAMLLMPQFKKFCSLFIFFWEFSSLYSYKQLRCQVSYADSRWHSSTICSRQDSLSRDYKFQLINQVVSCLSCQLQPFNLLNLGSKDSQVEQDQSKFSEINSSLIQKNRPRQRLLSTKYELNFQIIIIKSKTNHFTDDLIIFSIYYKRFFLLFLLQITLGRAAAGSSLDIMSKQVAFRQPRYFSLPQVEPIFEFALGNVFALQQIKFSSALVKQAALPVITIAGDGIGKSYLHMIVSEIKFRGGVSLQLNAERQNQKKQIGFNYFRHGTHCLIETTGIGSFFYWDQRCDAQLQTHRTRQSELALLQVLLQYSNVMFYVVNKLNRYNCAVIEELRRSRSDTVLVVVHNFSSQFFEDVARQVEGMLKEIGIRNEPILKNVYTEVRPNGREMYHVICVNSTSAGYQNRHFNSNTVSFIRDIMQVPKIPRGLVFSKLLQEELQRLFSLSLFFIPEFVAEELTLRLTKTSGRLLKEQCGLPCWPDKYALKQVGTVLQLDCDCEQVQFYFSRLNSLYRVGLLCTDRAGQAQLVPCSLTVRIESSSQLLRLSGRLVCEEKGIWQVDFAGRVPPH